MATGMELITPEVRSQLSGTSAAFMQAAGQNLRDVQGAVGAIEDRYKREQELAWREKERQDRLAQQAIDNERAKAILDMQQRSEQRDIDKIAKEDATKKAVAEYANKLGSYNKDFITEKQGEDLLKAYNTQGADKMNELLGKYQTAYQNDYGRRRGMLEGIQAPTEVNGVTVDPTQILNTKMKYLDEIQRQVENKQKMDFESQQNALQREAQLQGHRINAGAQLAAVDKQIAAQKSRDQSTYDREMKLAQYKFQHSPDTIKQITIAGNLANTEYNLLPKSEQKKYGSVEKYLQLNNTRIQNAAREEVLNPKASDFSVWTSQVGNPDTVAEFITDAKASGFTNSQIQRALSAAPKGSSIFDIGLPELDVKYAQKLLNSSR